MDAALRQRFDNLLEEVLGKLPEFLQEKLEEVPLVVEDTATAEHTRRTGLGPREILCGLYTGIPLTDRSVMHSGTLPDKIYIFRDGVIYAAGGPGTSDRRLKRQIRITLLHEIGHHFGLDEQDLRELGYR